MELMIWTGQRRIDASRIGRQHVQKRRVEFSQSQGGKDLCILVAPQPLEAIVAIVAMPIESRERPCSLTTTHGKPFSNLGFATGFAISATTPACCSAPPTGMMRGTAELHFGTQSLKSISGHSGDAEVATYI